MKEFRRKEREVVQAIQFVQTKECIDELEKLFRRDIITLVGYEYNDSCVYLWIDSAIRREATPEMFQAVIIYFNASTEAKAFPSYWIIRNSEYELSVLSDQEFHELYEVEE